ncbi:MAG: (Fe-S)-binding protein [Lachnospiraceae bacterium]|nr:(Fe-S)-binding protein [Lachnospiraceae bacterium]
MNEVPELCKNKSECCGCAVCCALCPKEAIIMTADEEGYLYPRIDEAKCVRCSLCLKVCRFKQDQKERGRLV